MNVWKQVLHRVEQVVDRSDYDAWFASTRFVAQKGDTLDVAVPSQRHIDEIRERYGRQVRSALNEIVPEGLQIHFIVEGRDTDDLGMGGGPVREELPAAVFNPATVSTRS